MTSLNWGSLVRDSLNWGWPMRLRLQEICSPGYGKGVSPQLLNGFAAIAGWLLVGYE